MRHLMLAAAVVLVFSSQACAYSYGPSWGVTLSLGGPSSYVPAPPPPPPPAYGYGAGYAQGYARGYANGSWQAYTPPPPPPPRYYHRHHRGYYRGW
ncbi:hypothetical protein NNJEOMEG_01377 [Fundidesulfovibrio magnetotacticus]|uniref:Uncharacterized protein n=1 Tax=Fundidesulfovibrio magnetotacticus TaxID=2730080 RepID=A0A6V8LLI3_9BACT|nr:hypothetical protein [Fundidesulfovibrio magnetotacticus]GFK93543.1 hypothetical protein NNJEOMEG_01377 [Fundidesulfovibrio magnetotacticus]